MVFQMYRRHTPVLSIPSGWSVVYFGDSIGDKWTLESGVTQGKWRDPIDALFGFVRRREGLNANDWTRGSIAGRMISAATGQTLAAENNFVTACLAQLPDVVVVELGTNDWFFATNALTPAVYGTSFDAMMTGLTANVPVKSVQAVVPTTATTGGSYKLLYSTSTTGLIAHNATIATINAALAAATPSAIPFVASTLQNDPPLSNGVPLMLTATTAGANAVVAIGTNTVTGGPIATDGGGLGGTPAVKLIVFVGPADHSAATSMNLPANAFPSWATSVGNAWQQLDAVTQAKVRFWNNHVNGIPVVNVDMRGIPQSLLIDTTHPTDPAGTAYYVDRIVRALTMAD